MVLGVRIKKELICIYLKTLARSLQNALSLNVYKLMIDNGGGGEGVVCPIYNISHYSCVINKEAMLTLL